MGKEKQVGANLEEKTVWKPHLNNEYPKSSQRTMSACEVDKAMDRLIQMLLKGCSNGVSKLAHDGDSHLH